MTQSAPITLHSNEYNQGLRYYPVAINLDGCTTIVILVILLMIHLVEYTFQTKQKIKT